MNATRTLPTYDRADTAGLLRALEDDGFALVPGMLDRGELAECRRRVDELRPFAWDRYRGADGTCHFKCVFNRDPYWLRFLDPQGVIEAAEAAMGRDCNIIGMTACRKEPGSGAADFSMHVDHALALPPSPYAIDEELLVSGR